MPRCRCTSQGQPWTIALLLVAIGSCPIAAQAADRFSHIEPGTVRLEGEIGRRIQITADNNLLVLNVQRDFLQPFIDRKSTGGYIGLGKLIDSFVWMAAQTGDPRLLQRKREVVAAALATQEADGYLGLMVPNSRVWKLWDTHEMAYLIVALSHDYQLLGEKPSLEAARKIADYLIAECTAHPERDLGEAQITAHMASTGLDDALLTLSTASGDPKYRQFVVTLRKLPEWDMPIVRGRWGKIEGHAYAYLAHALAQTELARIAPDPRLLGPLQKAADFLTRQDGLVITGTCGDHECWHDTQQGTTNLGETCATAYLLRVWDDCLRREGDSRYGDLMERSIYNALFAAQSPDGRRIRYYTPFDGPRVYFPDDTYCCPCNFRRIVAELPNLAYYRSENGLAVNLYSAGKATVPLGTTQLTVRQETDYPTSGHIVLHLEPSAPTAFPLKLRIPRWCSEAKVTVNDQPVETAVTPGQYCTLQRTWKAGDHVTLELAMPWRLVKGRVAQAGRVAVMRGPLVFCLNPTKHPALKEIDLRLIVLDPASLEGPFPDDSVRPGGLACRVQAWTPGAWYPFVPRDLQLTLTEFADPDGHAIFFQVPDPKAEMFVEDELVERH